ncbi:MAG: hypothetical protein Q4E11_06065 [Corynebacterium sp.]|uniref:hypothetical protein n=1 Tax=Corynebacterium sp. TaxID=1720 RepID=UPI0026DADD0F|nr:hypothetical protein [Corynebacterium sp.]MDO5030134.1 hypothetical protein [Corynebacterium sp.]
MKNSKRNSDDHNMADLDAIARSLQNDPGTAVNVPVVVTSGVIVALIVLSFAYSWPLWISLALIVLLGAVMVVSYTRRPPVAPLELTQTERERVRRVLRAHGTRAAITLVRGLYPEESPAAAARTVKLVSERMVAEQKKRDNEQHNQD